MPQLRLASRGYRLFLAVLGLSATLAAQPQTRPIRGPLDIQNHSGVIRIACVGDSITQAAPRSAKGEDRSWPGQLAGMLEMRWPGRCEIGNFGRSSATLLRKGEVSYWDQPELQEALDFAPHVVVINLGTNDSTDVNWVHRGDFVGDYLDLVDRLAALPSKPRIWLSNLTPIFPRFKRYVECLHNREECVFFIMQVAAQRGLPVLNLHSPLRDRDDLFPDGIHPDAGGKAIIAATIFSALTSEDSPRRPTPTKPLPPGYTIPIVDLAGDRERQVVVDREPGQYLGHPTTVLLEDQKTMIAVYPKGHGRGPIVMKRSSDGGRTWSERLPTPENWATSKETPTIHRVIEPETGRKRLIIFSGLHPVRLAASEDDGQSWSPLRKVGDWGGIVAMASVIRRRNGEYLAMFHDDGRFIRGAGKSTGVMTLYQSVSADGGLTWSEPDEILARSEIHLCEPGIIRSPDGKRLAALLRENRRRRNSHVIFSDDEGQSWSAPRELPAALTGDRHTGRYAPDGRLFISFRDTARKSSTQGDWVGWVGTWEDIVEGREGQYRVRLEDNHHKWDCAYPGVEVLPGGTFVATTYGYWTPGAKPYILSVRFKLDELDRRLEER